MAENSLADTLVATAGGNKARIATTARQAVKLNVSTPARALTSVGWSRMRGNEVELGATITSSFITLSVKKAGCRHLSH